ncbi:30S ribosomal protein S6 [Candidatus Uhrbacteria bacterium]|nr:30S ribosomal protein S6 [Candidatus Uhrbacteria bacterium]
MTYELLYIVSGDYTEKEVEGVQETVLALLAKYGATPGRHENLGKIRLAYPIKGIQFGTYILVYFEAAPEAMQELDRGLALAPEVLRHMITVPSKLAQERKYEITSYVAPLSEEAREARGGDVATTPPRRDMPKLMAPTPAALAPTTPISMEELDQKLDAIAEGGDITKQA